MYTTSINSAFPQPVPNNNEFTIGWICMRALELVAAREALDIEYGKLPRSPRPFDQNFYELGRIGRNNVVMAVIPSNAPNMTMAARVSAEMKATFPSIQVGIMVTTGSGIPSRKNDIRLGDVIVGTPDRTFKGVVGFREGGEEGIERVGTPGLDEYSRLLVAAVLALRADRAMKVDSKVPFIVSRMFHGYPEKKEAHSYQGSSHDKLFDANYPHQDSNDQHCLHCESTKITRRAARKELDPVVHHGTIASADKSVTDTAVRELLDMRFGAKGIQVGAAGLNNDFPTLVVCGVCDYADTHKNEHWSRYAAAVAAAYAKELLATITTLRPDHLSDTIV